jgi:hypothetical protein
MLFSIRKVTWSESDTFIGIAGRSFVNNPTILGESGTSFRVLTSKKAGIRKNRTKLIYLVDYHRPMPEKILFESNTLINSLRHYVCQKVHFWSISLSNSWARHGHSVLPFEEEQTEQGATVKFAVKTWSFGSEEPEWPPRPARSCRMQLWRKHYAVISQ